MQGNVLCENILFRGGPSDQLTSSFQTLTDIDTFCCFHCSLQEDWAARGAGDEICTRVQSMRRSGVQGLKG